MAIAGIQGKLHTDLGHIDTQQRVDGSLTSNTEGSVLRVEVSAENSLVAFNTKVNNLITRLEGFLKISTNLHLDALLKTLKVIELNFSKITDTSSVPQNILDQFISITDKINQYLNLGLTETEKLSEKIKSILESISELNMLKIVTVEPENIFFNSFAEILSSANPELKKILLALKSQLIITGEVNTDSNLPTLDEDEIIRITNQCIESNPTLKITDPLFTINLQELFKAELNKKSEDQLKIYKDLKSKSENIVGEAEFKNLELILEQLTDPETIKSIKVMIEFKKLQKFLADLFANEDLAYINNLVTSNADLSETSLTNNLFVITVRDLRKFLSESNQIKVKDISSIFSNINTINYINIKFSDRTVKDLKVASDALRSHFELNLSSLDRTLTEESVTKAIKHLQSLSKPGDSALNLFTELIKDSSLDTNQFTLVRNFASDPDDFSDSQKRALPIYETLLSQLEKVNEPIEGLKTNLKSFKSVVEGFDPKNSNQLLINNQAENYSNIGRSIKAKELLNDQNEDLYKLLHDRSTNEFQISGLQDSLGEITAYIYSKDFPSQNEPLLLGAGKTKAEIDNSEKVKQELESKIREFESNIVRLEALNETPLERINQVKKYEKEYESNLNGILLLPENSQLQDRLTSIKVRFENLLKSTYVDFYAEITRLFGSISKDEASRNLFVEYINLFEELYPEKASLPTFRFLISKRDNIILENQKPKNSPSVVESTLVSTELLKDKSKLDGIFANLNQDLIKKSPEIKLITFVDSGKQFELFTAAGISGTDRPIIFPQEADAFNKNAPKAYKIGFNQLNPSYKLVKSGNESTELKTQIDLINGDLFSCKLKDVTDKFYFIFVNVKDVRPQIMVIPESIYEELKSIKNPEARISKLVELLTKNVVESPTEEAEIVTPMTAEPNPAVSVES